MRISGGANWQFSLGGGAQICPRGGNAGLGGGAKAPPSYAPEAAQIIWGRSLERNHLVYSVFVGDGDSKAFHHVTTLNPYPLVKVRKEECLTHVAKRLKKNLKKIKPSTMPLTYIQHKLPEWKADYIASNYSTVFFVVEQHLINCRELMVSME